MSAGGRVAARLYAALLKTFPPGHRASYAVEMIDAFERERAALRRAHGPWAALRFTAAACLDVVRAGLGERRRQRRPRDARRFGSVLAFLGRDLMHAARSLARARTFSVVCILSIGIGIGTVVASLLVLRGLTGAPPGVTGERVVELLVIPQAARLTQAGDWAIETWSYPDFVDVRDADTGMTIAGWIPGDSALRLPGAAGVRASAAYVSANYFAAVGVGLALGRGFGVADGGPEVIVRHDVWRNRLGGDPNVIGSTIIVNGAPHVVVGVAQEGFRGHLARHRPGFEVWLPLSQHPRLRGPGSLRFNRDVDWVRVVGRLSRETSLTAASGAVSSIMAGLAERYPASNALKSASVEPYFPMGATQRFDINGVRATWLGASGMVLLVVCLNLSGMVLVRTAARERELAVRLAVGASRARLMQYLLAEALVLATLGGALGAGVVFGVPAVATWWFGEPLDVAFRPDLTIVGVCGALCFAASLAFGMLPAVRFSRPRVIPALKDESSGGRRVGRVHRLTAAAQAGFAVPFLVICGVMLDQVRTTATLDLGFRPAGLYFVPIDLALEGSQAVDLAFQLQTAQEQLARTDGVASVAVADGFPLDADYRAVRVTRDGAPQAARAEITRVSPGYLDATGVRLLRGRAFTTRDEAGSERVVVISEPAAALLFPSTEPLGEHLMFVLEGGTPQTCTVVGVTADHVASHLGTGQPQIFVPLAQHPASRVFVIARSSAPLAAMASAFENALAGFALDPGVIHSSLRTGEDRVRASRRELAVGSTAAGVVGAVALLLAALGVFGVVGFMVATRTREIGIRIALGASRPRVLGTVLRNAVTLVMPGVAGGLLLAVPLVRELSWYTLGVVEPLVYAVAAAVALGVALIAGLPAAYRAAAVEPIVAMRAE